MRPSDAKLEQSPLVAIYKAVGMLNSDWQVDFGTPQGDGWISGSALERPDHQPFKDLLRRIAERLNTNDRREVAAAFAIRLGWSAGAAIAPYFLQQCVPDIRLPNISLKFSEDTLFQKLSLHEPRGVMLRRYGLANHPSVEFLEDGGERPEIEGLWDFNLMCAHVKPNPGLEAALRSVLLEQAAPVVESLHAWSTFFKRSIWEQITICWSVQFTAVLHYLSRAATVLE